MTKNPPPPQDCLYIPVSELLAMFPDPNLRPAQRLAHFMKRYPETGRLVSQFQQKGIPGHDQGWPDWIFLPTICFEHIVREARGETATAQSVAGEMCILGALATWQYSQGIYLPGDLYLQEELAKTPLTGEMPVERFRHLPQWCIYVRTPYMECLGEPLHGFWAYLAWDFKTGCETLALLLDLENDLCMLAMHIGPWSIREGVQKIFDGSKKLAGELNEPGCKRVDNDVGEIAEALTPLIAIVLYLCSDTAEIEHEHTPGLWPAYPRAKKTRHGWKMFPAPQPTLWRYGKTAGALLRQAAESNAERQ